MVQGNQGNKRGVVDKPLEGVDEAIKDMDKQV